MRFLQTKFWHEFKSNHGWKNYAVDSDGFSVRVMVRSFNAGIKKISIAYVPMAPEFNPEIGTEAFAEKLSELALKIKDVVPENTICIRFDPAIDFENCENRDEFVKKNRHLKKDCKKNILKIHRSSVNVQPPDTVLLPLSGTEEEILSQMKSKWRYNIRLAAKKGVEVFKYNKNSENFEAEFEEFYKLFMITSERDGVSFHAKDYYLDLLNKDSSQENIEVNLYIAKHEGDYLAGIITLFCNGEGVYLYGASGNVKRNLMAAYLLQWTAIQDAKKFGCPYYDFYGCPPREDPSHPMHGLFLFKTGFGGKLIHRPGSFDVICRGFDYSMYRFLEKMRAWFFRVLVKKLKGR